MAEISQATIANLLRRFYEDYTKTEGQREQRYASGLSDLAQVTGLYGPGYGAGMEKAALAGANQSLISRGLGGTTRPQAVSAGLKAEFEDLRRGKIAEALTRTAEYKRMFPESTATAGILSHLATGGFGAGLSAKQLDLAQQTALSQGIPAGGGTIYGGTYGASSFPDMFSIAGESGFGGVSAPNFQSPTNGGGQTSSGATSGNIQGTGFRGIQEYDPSMVGSSMWAQQGSQASMWAQQASSGKFDPGGRKIYGSILEAQKAGPGSLALKGSTYYEITSSGAAKRVGYI